MPGFLARLTALAAGGMLAAAPVVAQVRDIDPNDAIGSRSASAARPAGPTNATPVPPAYNAPAASTPTRAASSTAAPSSALATPATPPVPTDNTWDRDDVVGAAERTFGKGAAGLAEIVEKALKDQGRPNAYIAGSEGSGAVVVGLRYGSGTMSHKVEGERKVHWTGPSVGFDLGGDANKVFILVYNLYDTDDLFRRFPAAEGRLYFIGGFAATYLRRGNIVLIPIRLGVGYRAGINAGYLKFSKKGKWFPL